MKKELALLAICINEGFAWLAIFYNSAKFHRGSKRAGDWERGVEIAIKLLEGIKGKLTKIEFFY